MKSVISYVVIVILFAITMTGWDFKISPTFFKVRSFWEFAGWILLIISVVLISYNQGKSRYESGYTDAMDDIINHKNK